MSLFGNLCSTLSFVLWCSFLSPLCLQKSVGVLFRDDMVLTLRGGIRYRQKPPLFRCVAVNTTSAMSHWRTLAAIDAELVVVSEIRTNLSEQEVISRAVRSQGWSFVWAEPIIPGPNSGMQGRSGGTAIMHKDTWECSEGFALDLEAAPQNSLASLFTHKFNGSQLLVGPYYGRPEDKPMTCRDMARIAEAVSSSDLPFLVAGDVNIGDEDEQWLPTEALRIDTHLWDSHLKGVDPPATFHTKQASRRIDRIFVAPQMVQHMTRTYIDDDTVVPGHSAIGIELRLDNVEVTVQVARPSLTKGRQQAAPELVEYSRQEAIRQTQEIDWNNDIDYIFDHWSAIWEDFLRAKFNHCHKEPRARGRLAAKRKMHIAPLTPKRSLWMRKLSDLLHNLRLLRAQLALGRPGNAKLWAKLTNASKPISLRYGVPELELDGAAQPLEVMCAVIDSTYAFYWKVWKAELSQQRAVAKLAFRGLLSQHAGINRTTTRLLRPKHMGLPRVKVDDHIVAHPQEVLRHVQAAWSAFFQAEPLPVDREWLHLQAPAGHVHEYQVPAITGEMLTETIAKKSKATAPGQDSWHLDELAALPPEALCDLARLLNRCEIEQKLPAAMTHAWVALLPKSEDATPPLAVRPISVLTAGYRVWASMRATHLQAWAASRFQAAYVRGRSIHQCLGTSV